MQPDTLRRRLLDNIPQLPERNLRNCQVSAVHGLERSLAQNKPRALIHMATGAGKTFTAITAIYRLLKFGGAKRILFLVDTRNLGKQAHQEFMAYTPPDDGRYRGPVRKRTIKHDKESSSLCRRPFEIARSS